MSLRLRIGAQLDVPPFTPEPMKSALSRLPWPSNTPFPSRMFLRLRSENPFINFYLRDFRAKRADGTKGISFVTASVPVTFPRPSRLGH
ncbi:hypothetical protein ACOMHN_039608 [Nucella lapillus]